MKKILFSAFICLFCSSALFANPFGEFNNVLDKNKISKPQAQEYLDALAGDVGQAISGGSYGIGESIGFFGIYAGLNLSIRQVSGGNKIVDKAGYNYLMYPVFQFEFGLPYGLDAIIRGTHFYNSTVLGGGLRWEVLKGHDLIIPAISVQSVYNHVQVNDNGNKFNAWNLKTSGMFYFNEIPIVKPYMFVSFDTTDLKAKSSDYSNLSSSVQGAGYGLGVNVKLLAIGFSGSITMYRDVPNYNISVFLEML
ncbi:MAG: hypothetical protein FWG57_07980 [Endomicrobia bacterium]|nr:hypothetical protein [Bacillota bacterium]MCL1972906.1 hypothetical protein [Endomicrobiia bacterium]